MKKAFFISVILALIISGISSCKKDQLITDKNAKLHFSSDSVLFDTVFTTIGSATRNIRVVNKYNQKIKISSISLQTGNASPFIINVDGSKGKVFNDIEIAAYDSMYIFIQVNVNPTNVNSPLIISDNLQFTVNGNTQNVYLEAWGQDAYYHKPTNAIKFAHGGYLAYSTVAAVNNTVVTWVNDKPHVIYGWLVVDSTQTLIINPGVRVYLHQNAGLWVYRYGTLKVQGTYASKVTFQGDRFEKDLADIPGQWDRIWINEGSLNNSIDYAVIKNGYIGIQAEMFDNNFNNTVNPRRLRLTNTTIQNMNKWGLYSVGFNIYGGNNVICNCKEYCANLTLGGRYTFIHTTFANFWNKDSRSLPCVHIDNHTDIQALPMDTCYFGNCIIDGSMSSELEMDLNTTGAASLQPVYTYSYNFLRTPSTNTVFTMNGNRCSSVMSLTSDYADKNNYYFYLGGTSSAIDFGSGAISDALKFPIDITGFGRTTNPDAGAFEK